MVNTERKWTWWRFWADTFIVMRGKEYPWVFKLILPCHEDWWFQQPEYTNDNEVPWWLGA